MTARPGWVYLVGAGPGDPGLITRRGLELLRSCDVLLYDRLVAPDLLREAQAQTELVFVGKEPGEKHSRQVVSDALMVARARENKSIVRLKGGDPFVFGRGGEEALLLRASDVPFEVVPGVSSAIAVPAYAGIPVTHRGASASFVVLTGREENESAPSEELTVGADTVVLLMGVAALERTAERLMAGGRDPAEPAAAIGAGTTGRQRTVTGELRTIAALVRDAGIAPPATTVIGPVVEMREKLAWFEQRPLFGRSVAITRPPGQARELTELLTGLGADVVALPLIDIAPPQSWDSLDAAVRALAAGAYEWALFASVNAVEATAARLTEAGFDARAFASGRIGSVGTATTKALERIGLVPDVVADRATAISLVRAIGAGTGRVLFPRVEDAPPEPIKELEDAGWSVEDVVAYRNAPGAPDQVSVERVRDGSVDSIVFTSPSTVERFEVMVGPPGLLEPIAVVSIGPSTTAAATARGIRVSREAETQDVSGLVDAIVAVAAERR